LVQCLHSCLAVAEAGVARAFRKLEQIRKDTVWWEAAAQPGALIAAGIVNMSSGYTLWFDPDQERNRHTRIVWRQSLYDLDSWAIPKGTPKRDEAYRFIAFASLPERQKVLSEQLIYGPTNRNAVELLPARLAGNLPSSTPNLAGALRIDTAFWIERGDALEKRFNAWARARPIDLEIHANRDGNLCLPAKRTSGSRYARLGCSSMIGALRSAVVLDGRDDPAAVDAHDVGDVSPAVVDFTVH
jgi:hypothetical protein